MENRRDNDHTVTYTKDEACSNIAKLVEDFCAHEVALASQILELHKSKAGAKTQSEVDVYERQIKSVDEAIDGLVYELYELNQAGIKIIETK